MACVDNKCVWGMSCETECEDKEMDDFTLSFDCVEGVCMASWPECNGDGGCDVEGFSCMEGFCKPEKVRRKREG